ncbi:Origin recognition complex, subunit 1 [Mortierella alpina]|uniref:Origin recognition complex subunit 1 n=1 Tax=Mortierella alpina TaxID=64518 RepID=A0A9P6J5U7_MORAP|nr:Origin recognition complex, subunit 1 [Mortierella alpina]
MAAATRKANKRLQSARSQAARRDTLFPASDFEAEEELEWVGEPLNKDSLIQRKPHSLAGEEPGSTTGLGSTTSRRATRGSGLSNIPFYRGFRKGTETYMVGDTVLLRNEHFSRKFECPHVAQILSLWETEEGDCLGDFRWFHQAEDIAKLRRYQRTGNYPERLETGEIVYTLDDDENEISTVVAKCHVLDEAEWRRRFGESEAVLDVDQQDRIWFSRGLVRKMSGYHAVPWKGNEEMLKLKEEKEARPRTQTATKPAGSASVQIPRGKTHDGRRKVLEVQSDDSDHTSEDSASDYNQEDSSDDDADKETSSPSVVKTEAKSLPVRKRKPLGPPRALRRAKTIVLQAPTTQRLLSASEPTTAFELARNRLHVKAVPDSLPCREDEFLEIQEHLESAIEEGSGSCIYISGVPGTGKTATVHEVIRSLQAKADEGEISPFQFVEINGMKVTEPSYAYVLLWLALSDQKVTANHALQLLEKQFSTPGPRRLPCVVLMDELDLLVTSKQTVMYNFFEWPNWLHSRLIVVAVANTMDLPERMLSNKVSSRLGLTRINFQPYTYQQLVKIVESRLAGINAFRREAIEFAARKVGAVSGDARRALDICRRAVEIVESSAQKIEDQRRKATNNGSFDDPGLPQEQLQVTIRIVDQAIKEMFASPNVRLIQTASLHQKLFLVALTAKLRRLGLAEAEFSEVAHAHLQMCRLHNIEPPMLSDLSAICASLGSSRCLLVESGKQDIHQRVRLSVSEEDVIMALKVDPLFKRLLDTLPSAPAS